MAGLKKMMRKDTGNTVRETTRYSHLPQNPSDGDDDEDEDENDDVLFSRRNGFSDKEKEDVNRNQNKTDTIEMAILTPEEEESVKMELVSVKVKKVKKSPYSRLRTGCFIGSGFLALCGILVITVFIPLMKRDGLFSHKGSHTKTAEWVKELENWGSESCVRLVDVDDDGRMDVIFSVASPFRISKVMTKELIMEECKKRGQPYPCLGTLVALRGYDGKELWRAPLHVEAFEINCDSIDINQDGKHDCVVAGRVSTIAAIDPKNGHLLWMGDEKYFVDRWNNYNVLVLPDLDGDKVPEVLVPHGGDPRIPPEWRRMHAHKRASGRLILMSGKTGKVIGRYLDVPEEKELYMSPVLHRTRDGSMYILFGSGGETVPGSFLAISVRDFYSYVQSLPINSSFANVPGAYRPWGKAKKDKNGIMEIYRSTTKGVMVPPVCVDMDGDGVKDILMSAYDGAYILYNGETLEAKWNVNFPDYETYSTPAPAYFNDDDTLDFMLHINKGAWPNYNHSMALILDGTNGKIMWMFPTNSFEMASDLVLRSTQEHRDAFVFRIQGREGNSKNNMHDLLHGINPQRVVVKRHTDQGFHRSMARENSRLKKGYRAQNSLSRHKYGSKGDQGFHSAGRTAPIHNHLPVQNLKRGSANVPLREYAGTSYKTRNQPDWSEYGKAESVGNSFRNQQSNNNPFRQRDEQIRFKDYSKADDYTYSETTDTDYNQYNDNVNKNPQSSQPRPTSIGSQVSSSKEKAHDDSIDAEILEKLKACEHDQKEHVTEIFIIDRSVQHKPIRLLQIKPVKIHYNISDYADEIRELEAEEAESGETKRSPHGEDMQTIPGHQYSIDPTQQMMCTVSNTMERATSAIGDVDGDGTPDLLVISVMQALIRDQGGGFVALKWSTLIHKVNVVDALAKETTVPINVKIPAAYDKILNKEPNLKNITFASLAKQTWTGYMGSKGDSIYT